MIDPGFTDHLLVTASASAYRTAVAEFTGDGPVPVLAGPGAERLATVGLRRSSVPADGVVFAGDVEFAPVAAVLAAATGRTLRSGSLADARRESDHQVVTFVAAPDSVGPEELAAVGALPLGVLTAPDLAAASALAARCVYPEHWTTGDVVLADNFAEPPTLVRTGAEPVTALLRTEAVRKHTGTPLALFAAHGHSRDCLLHFDDGGICGRLRDDPVLGGEPRVSGHHDQPTSCMLGHGCWRPDIAMGSHVRATELDAAVVVLDGCTTLAVSRGRVAADAGLAMGFLSGAALAVVGSPGARSGPAIVAPLLGTLLACGYSLGAAVAEVNAVIDGEPTAQGPVTLLGDAGLRLAPPTSLPAVTDPGGAAAALVTAPADTRLLLDHDLDALLVCPRPNTGESWVISTDGAALPAPVHVVPAPRDLAAECARLSHWITALVDTEVLGVGISAGTTEKLRGQLAARADWFTARTTAEYTGAAAAVDALRADLTDLQRAIAEDLLEAIGASFFSFGERWTVPVWFHARPDSHPCARCGAVAATEHDVEFPGRPGHLPVGFTSCARCGETGSGHRLVDHDLSVTYPADVTAGEPFDVTVSVTNHGTEPSTVTVGVTIAHYERMHAYLRGAETAVVEPGRTHHVVVRGAHDPEAARSEMQNLWAVVLADGALTTRLGALWVYA